MAFLLVSPLVAFADELGDVRAELDAKAGELQEITNLVKESGDDLAALDKEIASLTAEIKDQQEKRSDLQHRISGISKVMYKNGDQLNLVSIITNAESFADVLDQIEVRRKVLTEYLTLSEEQQRVDAELQVSYKEVSNQKDEQTKKLADLRDQQKELDSIVSKLKGREADLTAAQQAALAAAAEAEARAQAAAAQDVNPQPSQPSQPVANSEGSNEQQEHAETTASAETGWSSGAASAYGGSTDDTDDPTVPTATGTYVDDYSMGIVVPMAWGPEDYYGRSVEITYNGKTVVATVTDCGGMNGGERSLDLQPGVWKALGSDSCDDWGVREVQYRFL
jgi:peptidoglycan hydrolase CwlO-like protein